MNQQQPQADDAKNKQPDESASINVSGQILIRDKQTGEVLVKKSD